MSVLDTLDEKAEASREDAGHRTMVEKETNSGQPQAYG